MLVTLEMIQKAAALKPAELVAVLNAGGLPVPDVSTIESCKFLGMRENGIFVYQVVWGPDDEAGGVANVYAQWKRPPFEATHQLVGVL